MNELLYLKDEQIKEFIEKIFIAYRESFNDFKTSLNRHSLGLAHHKVIHLLSLYNGITISGLLKKLKITKQSLNRVLKDLIKNTKHNIKVNKINKIKKVFNSDYPIVCFSNKFKNIEKEIRFFLKQKMYNNKSVLIKNNSGKKIVKKLYSLIYKNPYKFLNKEQLKKNKTYITWHIKKELVVQKTEESLILKD